MMLLPALLGVLQAAVPLHPGDIVAANLRNSTVSVHAADGTFRGTLADSTVGDLRGPTGVAFDSQGRLHVASSRSASILRFAPDGTFDQVFIKDAALGSPFSIAFGPDQHLYISSGTHNRVLRYDGSTGEFLGVAAEGHGLGVPIGLALTPDGTLYVANARGKNVLAFNGQTGAFLDTAAVEGLGLPSDVRIEADGSLLVSSAVTKEVIRFDPGTARRLGVVVTLPPDAVPMGLARSCSGDLIIGDFSKSRLFRVGAAPEPVLLSDIGLSGPENLAVVPGCDRNRPQ